MSSTESKLEATLDITNPQEWGVHKHGAVIHVDSNIRPSLDLPWVFDVENDPDGSVAGIGITTDGINLFFYHQIEDKDFFKDAKLIAHNAKYDVQKLRQWGFNVSPDQIVWDTELAEYVKNSASGVYALKDLIKERYSFTYPEFKELAKALGDVVSKWPLDVLTNYNGTDVHFTYRLWTDQTHSMNDTEIQYLETLELPTLRVLLEMEERGVLIDADYIKDLDNRMSTQVSDVVASLRRSVGAGFNLNSHQQIKRHLLEKHSLRLRSTEADELQKYANVPFISDILKYRTLTKLTNTYIKPLVERSQGKSKYRLHSNFNQCVAQTGRLSSSRPNLQNIPVRRPEGAAIRKGFIVNTGNIMLDADFSQIQPTLMAHHSQDEHMMDIFTSGKSIYSLVTGICDLLDRCNGNEKEAKAIAKILWLALAFNAGARTLSSQTGLSVSDCYIFIQKMERKLTQFFYWKNKTIAEAEIRGYVTTLFGRKIPLRKGLAHLGPNYIIQGGESEIMKMAQIQTRHLPSVAVIHDELVFEVPKSQATHYKAEIQRIMPNVVKLSVPIRIEIGEGNNWLEAKN